MYRLQSAARARRQDAGGTWTAPAMMPSRQPARRRAKCRQARWRNSYSAEAAMTGIVVRIPTDKETGERKGFMFVRGEDGIERFVHRSGLAPDTRSFEKIRTGDAVEFTHEDADKGPRAKNLRVQKFNARWKRSVVAPPSLPLPISETDYLQKMNPYAYHRRETLRVNLADSSFGSKELVRVGLSMNGNGTTEEEWRTAGIAKK